MSKVPFYQEWMQRPSALRIIQDPVTVFSHLTAALPQGFRFLSEQPNNSPDGIRWPLELHHSLCLASGASESIESVHMSLFSSVLAVSTSWLVSFAWHHIPTDQGQRCHQIHCKHFLSDQQLMQSQTSKVSLISGQEKKKLKEMYLPFPRVYV